MAKDQALKDNCWWWCKFYMVPAVGFGLWWLDGWMGRGGGAASNNQARSREEWGSWEEWERSRGQ